MKLGKNAAMLVGRQLLSGAILIVPVAAHAQASPATGQADAGIGKSDEIVVTAQRRAERLQDVPISVTVQTGAQLASAGVNNIRDLAFVTPGLTLQAQGSFVQPAIRGISTLVTGPGADNPIALYIDGVYEGSQAGASLDLPDVERVEVSKGPQGTLFGRNSTGGAIQIFTRGPDFTTSGDVSATAGWYDGAGTSRSSYDLGFKGFVTAPLVTDKIAMSLAFSYRDVDGYGTNIVPGRLPSALASNYGSDRTGFLKSYSVRGKLLFKLSDDITMLVTGYYLNRKTDVGSAGTVVDNLTAASQYPDGIYATKPWQEAYDAGRPESRIEDYGGSVKFTADTGIGSVTSLTSYSIAKFYELTDVDASYSPACLQTANFACITFNDHQPNKNFFQDFLFNSNKMGILRFSVGANYYHSNGKLAAIINDFSSGAGPGAPGVVYDPLVVATTKVNTSAFGVFAQADVDLTDKLILTGGLRYSYEKKKAYVTFSGGPYINFTNPHWDAFTPRVSLRYEITPRSNVYASFSRGFKSGIIPILSIGTPVNPETIDAYEVGFKTASRGFRFNMAAFRYDYKNLQVQSFTGTAIIPQNAASARIYGLELDGSADLTSEFSVHAGLTWLPKADYRKFPTAAGFSGPVTAGGLTPINGDVSGMRLVRAPKVNGTAGFTYKKDIGRGLVSFSTNVIYSSKFLPYEPFGVIVQHSYARVSSELVYEPMGSGLRIAGWVHNLTNTKSIGASSVSAGAARVVYEEPRELGVTVGYKF